ncbi:ATPase family AAA domain-containing protein FIGL1 [Tanacetum coccineum]|uniref:ATPase family AAA domain-containing protein FIGL1 n=1 Tax=Tanacetum coccineum TaxID=301880 RepID=A0ABQ5FRT3_9ASTR
MVNDKDFEANVKKLESLIEKGLETLGSAITYLNRLRKTGNAINEGAWWVNEPVKQQGGILTNGNPETSNAGISSTFNSNQLLSSSTNTKADHKLRSLPPKLIQQISNEIMDKDPNVHWDDIAGLHHAKKCVNEMVGTGKTMIGKAIAGEAKATFFHISASSLTSKWIGEGEKLVRALFGVASCYQPAVIFVDEIDSLLSKRKSEGEHEANRRLKTQLLIEMEGCDSVNDQVLLIGAKNRPQDLDEAARRRLTKRLYIPLPCAENLLKKDKLFKLSSEDLDVISKLTEGYSGSDMKNLVRDASMGPLREALTQGIEITKLKKEDMRPITLQDFRDSLQEVRPSVSLNELGAYEDWDDQFGSLSSSKTCVSSQQAGGLSDEKVKDHHRKKRKTSSLGEYTTVSDAQTCIDLDDDDGIFDHITVKSTVKNTDKNLIE